MNSDGTFCLQNGDIMTNYRDSIIQSGLTIYDEISVDNNNLFIPDDILENILNTGLYGKNLSGLPLRTRSKVVKCEICKLLGYPTPKSFKKTQPRFPAQNFDVYTQQSMNVQIWNEEIDVNRRLRIYQNQ